MHILLGFDKTLQQWVNSVMYKSINVYEGNPFFFTFTTSTVNQCSKVYMSTLIVLKQTNSEHNIPTSFPWSIVKLQHAMLKNSCAAF